MKKKTIDLTENMELAHNMAGCAVLLEIALAEPSTNKFNVSVMRAANSQYLQEQPGLKIPPRQYLFCLKQFTAKAETMSAFQKNRLMNSAKVSKILQMKLRKE